MGNGKTPDKPQQASAYPAEKRRRERLVAVAIAGFLALNFPMLSVFDLQQLGFGIPVLYWYLFGIWFGFLIAVALIMERRTRSGDALGCLVGIALFTRQSLIERVQAAEFTDVYTIGKKVGAYR